MKTTASAQTLAVMARYQVTTERALLRAIAAEFTRETGERYTIADAGLMLDGMLEAEYQRLAGGAYDRAPEPEPEPHGCGHDRSCPCGAPCGCALCEPEPMG